MVGLGPPPEGSPCQHGDSFIKNGNFNFFIPLNQQSPFMKHCTTIFGMFALLVCSFVPAQAQYKVVNNSQLLLKYGPNYEEVLDKYQDNPELLLKAERAYQAEQRGDVPFFNSSLSSLDDRWVGRSETEPNNFFDSADAIDDVLAMDGLLAPGEYSGRLIQGTLDAGDVDVFKFTIDPDRMYYFASTHSYDADGADGLDINARMFHQSDMDTSFAVNVGGITGNDKIAGDILGRNGDGRNGSGDFRLTGWSSPVDAATGDKLTGDFYLWIFNENGDAGSYHITAYSIPFDSFVSKFEPNQSNSDVLTNNLVSTLPSDAVVRTFMLHNPDTVKIVNPAIPVQSNSVFPQLLAEGDEDVDHYLLNYKEGHTMVIETLPYFDYYRDIDGTMGPGGTRLSDPRILVFDADYTNKLFDDDDAGREDMDGPNNIHSRLVLSPEDLAANGVTSDSPLWLWVSGWASSSRTVQDGDGTRNVDNRDPGRMMYKVYVHQYLSDPNEVEPNNSAEEANSIAPRADVALTASFADASEDWYRTFLNETRLYSLVTPDGATLEIFHESESDADGNTTVSGDLASTFTQSTANGTTLTQIIPANSGAYLIKLSGSGDYSFALVDKGQVYDGHVANEPDNDLADALEQDALEVGPGAAARNGMIYQASDVDNYYFNANTGTELTLSIGNTNSDLVSDFGVQMTLIGPDDAEIETSTGGIQHTAAADGQYVLRVTAVTDGDIGFYTVSGGEAFEEREGNDSFADANGIALDNVYVAGLTAGDVDYFKYSLEAGKLYSFRSYDNETGGALAVEFFDDPAGEHLLDDSGWADNYSGDNFKIANIIPSESKTYYLKISGGVGPYKISSRVNSGFLMDKDNGEPNNSAVEADAIGDYQAFGADVGQALFNINGGPRWFGDEDWFRVSLVAGQTVSAEAKPVGGDDWARDTDTRIVIFGADGTTELANDDDGGNDWYSLASHTAAEDGVVYVQVRTSRATADADDRSMNRGDYILNIDVKSVEAEPNNNFAEAAGNSLNRGFVDAAFDAADTIDIFKLALMEDHIYHVRTIKPDGAYDGGFNAKLFKGSDTTTNLLDTDNTGYNSRYSGSNLKLNIIPDETGDYFLQLDGDGTAGAYRVGLKGRSITDLKLAGEPNNSVADAEAIGPQEFDEPGESRTFMLYNPDFVWNAGDIMSTRYGDDLDFYAYDLAAGDTLIAQTAPADGPLWPRDYDGFMELYNAAGEMIADNDDGAFDWHSRIEHVAAEASRVYVMVRSQDFEGANDRDPSRGEYNLTVYKQDGTPIILVDTETDELPEKTRLSQNYPNPFNPVTNIQFAIPQSSKVNLAIYNVAGQLVRTLVDQVQPAGEYSVRFDGARLPSGVYFYRLETGSDMLVKQMVLIK